MCEVSRQGNIGLRADLYLNTGIENCQRTGIFLNSSDKSVTVKTAGTSFQVPAGKSITVPVGPEIRVTGGGRGVLVWTVTSAVLAAQMTEAPPMQEETAGVKWLETGATITLSAGTYSKLVFIDRGGSGGVVGGGAV